MKHILFTIILLTLGGCASWPDEGQGGWAEKYQNYPLTDEQHEMIYDTQETVVLSEFQHHVLKLDLLKAQGIQQCMPAQLLKAQIYENRIRRLIAAQMWSDAEHDLLIHLALVPWCSCTNASRKKDKNYHCLMCLGNHTN